MKRLTLAALLALTPLAAQAASPSALGAYGVWTAASAGSGRAKVCYAFTKVQASSLKIRGRGPVMLTVTERAGSADEVSLTAGYSYPAGSKITLLAGKTKLAFYSAGPLAYTQYGTQAVTAFKALDQVSVTATAPKGKKPVTDHFSLSGFSAAYKAIVKACS
jgi:invasion protein IalB